MRGKRYKLSSETVLQYQIMDKDTDLNENEVVDKLNELLEEKEYFERKKEYFLSKWSIVNAKNIQLRQEIDDLKEENEQLREELNNLKKDETMLYHYYTLARYGGDGV